ncbi:MAG: glycerophosphodiester phosphodiesterase family protein [Patescibacteria group bacterium]
MKIFAHRGVSHKEADENSLEAFCAAVNFGIDGIELDVRLTKDGIAVITHDKDLRRIAGDNRFVEDLTLEELQKITLRKGSSIPALDDVTACTPAPVQLDFEVKDAKALDVIVRKLRTSKGLRERSIISTFNHDVIERAHAELPEVPRILLRRRWPVRLQVFGDWMQDVKLYGIGLTCTVWTAHRVEWLEGQGRKAIAWEPFGLRSSKRRARRLADMGIEIAIVNQPGAYRVASSWKLGRKNLPNNPRY